MERFKGLTSEARLEHYERDRQLIKQSHKTQISFIGSALKIRMGVTVIGGPTGRGKTTANANIVADFVLRYPNRRALIITNEEVSSDVLDRVSCVLLNLDFYRYRDGLAGEQLESQIREQSLRLLEQIVVVSSQGLDMTCLEDVMEMLNLASENRVDLIILDYLQTVTWSRNKPELNAYMVSKELGIFFKEYGRKVAVPVIVFAQISNNPDPDKIGDFAERVQGDKTFVNHAVMTIELRPNFEVSQTQFYVHKDRFGSAQGQCIGFQWERGVLRPLGDSL